MWNNEFTLMLEACSDTDFGHLDQEGHGCNGYSNPSYCGMYDDGDFQADVMCCSCGGGNTRK